MPGNLLANYPVRLPAGQRIVLYGAQPGAMKR
jgi:hypothetical protein